PHPRHHLPRLRRLDRQRAAIQSLYPSVRKHNTLRIVKVQLWEGGGSWTPTRSPPLNRCWLWPPTKKAPKKETTPSTKPCAGWPNTPSTGPCSTPTAKAPPPANPSAASTTSPAALSAKNVPTSPATSPRYCG